MTTSPFNARIDAGMEAGAPGYCWTGLHGSSLALALLSAAQSLPGLMLVVTRSSHQSKILARDLQLLDEHGQDILHFPDREILPYDPFSAHPDIASDRLAALAAIGGLDRGILIVPGQTLLFLNTTKQVCRERKRSRLRICHAAPSGLARYPGDAHRGRVGRLHL